MYLGRIRRVSLKNSIRILQFMISSVTKTGGGYNFKSIKSPGEATWTQLFISYKNSAKNRGFEFLLSRDQFIHICSQNCYYCGSEPPPKNWYLLKNGKKTKRAS